METNFEDDFDRFCRIGKSYYSVSNEHSPKSEQKAGRHNLLEAPQLIALSRAGSLRENRNIKSSHNSTHYHSRRPSGSQRKTNEQDFHSQTPTKYETVYLRRHSISPNLAVCDNAKNRKGYKNHYSETTECILPDQGYSGNRRKLSSRSQLAPKSSAPTCLSYPLNPPSLKIISDVSPDKNVGLVRVRSFRRTKTGVVCDGDRDEFPRPIEISNDHLNFDDVPINNETDRLYAERKWIKSDNRRKSSSPSIRFESDYSDQCEQILANKTFTVQVLGASQVGKTTMCTQFLTSRAIDNEAETGGYTVENITIDVDGKQTHLLLFDNGDLEVVESADAYLVVYAIDDLESFEIAEQIISELVGRSKMSSAIVMVGNKSDLVRTRQVSTDEGKRLANVYSCGFFEVSISLNHGVNELLVGLVSSIKLANKRIENERVRLNRIANLRKSSSGLSPMHVKPPINAADYGNQNNLKHSIKKFFKKHFPL